MKKKRPPSSKNGVTTNSTGFPESSLKIGAYPRVSTDEQASVIEGSLDNQRHRMNFFVDVRNMQEPGWGHIVEFYVEDGYSAKDTNRPAYQRMMRDLKSGKINAIMVTELSRLSRNIPDFCGFHNILESLGAKFFSIKEQFDTSTPVGKMMLYNMVNLAQFEREQTSERVAINFHERAQRGLLNGGPAILGYDKDPSMKSTFIVNEAEAIQVRCIFDTFLEQRTLRRTIEAIAPKGIKPKARATKRNRLVEEGRWTTDSLGFVLRNLAYIGKREVNKANQNTNPDLLKTWERYSVVAASWPGIVDLATFSEVQKVLDHNRERERLRLETSESRVFAASGLCVCEECGRKLVGQSAHGRNKVHRYYVHSSKKGDVIHCSVKRIKADEIESKIADHLTDILLDAGYFEQITGRIQSSVTASPEILKQERARLAKELQKAELAVRNTFKIQSALDADSDAIREVAKELEALSRKKKGLEAEIENLTTQETQKEDLDDAITSLKANLEAFHKGWPKASAVTKKALLQGILYAVIVGPKGLKIQYRLRHDLNRPVTPEDIQAAKERENKVIEMANKRRAKTSASDAASTASVSTSGRDGTLYNLGINGSQVVGIGRGCRIRTCDPAVMSGLL